MRTIIYGLLTRKRINLIFTLILISIVTLHYIFALRTDSYFTEDDFFVLSYIRDKTIAEIATDFLVNGDLFGYGKILGYLLIKILFQLFGTNAEYFNLTLYLLQTINVLLFYKLAKLSVKNIFAPFFAALIFSRLYLNYYSNLHEILVGLFSLSTILLFTKNNFSVKAKVFFVLALLSKEVAFIIPFLLTAYQMVKRRFNRNSLLPFYVILVIYALWAVRFYYLKYTANTAVSSELLLSTSVFREGILYYFPIPVFLTLLIIPVITKQYRTYYILACALLALFPVYFLVNRREIYYSYFPNAIVALFLLLNLTKFKIKTILIYPLLFLVFGGRSVLPKITMNKFPNWQKISLQKIVNRTTDEIEKGNNEIYLGDITLERDALLMLETDTIDLFLPDNFRNKYNFHYSFDQTILYKTDI